jgi:hypothetical protein
MRTTIYESITKVKFMDLSVLKIYLSLDLLTSSQKNIYNKF